MKYVFVASGLLLAGCQPSTHSDPVCRNWSPAHAPLDVFDLDLPPPALATGRSAALSYAQRRALLHDAYKVSCCLAKDARHDSTYVEAYFYATVARLNRAPPAPCQVLIHASMDDFSGLFLVLQASGKPSASLYVAGSEGSGGTEEDGFFYSPRVTTGRMLTDSLVQVTTRTDCLASRRSGEHSYTEATTEVYRLDYRTAAFHLVSRQQRHLALATRL